MKLTVMKCPNAYLTSSDEIIAHAYNCIDDKYKYNEDYINLKLANEVYMNNIDARRVYKRLGLFFVKVYYENVFGRDQLFVYTCRPLAIIPRGTIALNGYQSMRCGKTVEVGLFEPDNDGGVPCASIEMKFDLDGCNVTFVDYDGIPAQFRRKFDQHYFKIGQKVAMVFDGAKLEFTVKSCETSPQSTPGDVPAVFYQIHDKTDITLLHSGNWKLQDKKNRPIITDIVSTTPN